MVFYSHLSKIADGIKVWDIVSQRQILWNVWKSWVPDRNYTDYHLHFAVQKNPYNLKQAWKYSFDDYMKWDWYFKWESPYTVIEKQYTVFEWPQLSYSK